MDKKNSAKAVFQGPNKLKVGIISKNGGTGTVTSNDVLFNCECEKPYKPGTEVSLTATPGTDSTFIEWTGKPCKDEPSDVCTFKIDKNNTVKAIFNGS
jgi:hypothetical protein